MKWKNYAAVAVVGACPFGIFWLSGEPFVRSGTMAMTGVFSLIFTVGCACLICINKGGEK